MSMKPILFGFMLKEGLERVNTSWCDCLYSFHQDMRMFVRSTWSIRWFVLGYNIYEPKSTSSNFPWGVNFWNAGRCLPNCKSPQISHETGLCSMLVQRLSLVSEPNTFPHVPFFWQKSNKALASWILFSEVNLNLVQLFQWHKFPQKNQIGWPKVNPCK